MSLGNGAGSAVGPSGMGMMGNVMPQSYGGLMMKEQDGNPIDPTGGTSGGGGTATPPTSTSSSTPGALPTGIGATPPAFNLPQFDRGFSFGFPYANLSDQLRDARLMYQQGPGIWANNAAQRYSFAPGFGRGPGTGTPQPPTTPPGTPPPGTPPPTAGGLPTPPSDTYGNGMGDRPPQAGNPADQVYGRPGTTYTPPPQGNAGNQTRPPMGNWGTPQPGGWLYPRDPNGIYSVGPAGPYPGAPGSGATPPPSSVTPPPVTTPPHPGLDVRPKMGLMNSGAPQGEDAVYRALATGNSAGIDPSTINQYGPGGQKWNPSAVMDQYRQSVGGGPDNPIGQAAWMRGDPNYVKVFGPPPMQ